MHTKTYVQEYTLTLFNVKICLEIDQLLRRELKYDVFLYFGIL